MSLSVVHLLAPAPYGGLESVVEVLAPAQIKSGLDVTVVGVFSREPAGEPFWESVIASGVPAVRLVLPGRRYLAERKLVAAILRDRGARILHTHGYRPDVVDAPMARSLGIRTVTTVHGFTRSTRRGRLYEWLQRRSHRRFDAVVCVSARLRDEALASGVPEKRVHTVPNAWRSLNPTLSQEEARVALGLPLEATLVGWVGRLQRGKGPDIALRALEHLEMPAELVFMGDGPARLGLEAESRRLGLQARVRFLGRIPGAARYLRALDAFLMSSWSEGTPMVILEAMSSGVPIVTTAVGGIPDILSEKEAILVPPGDAVGLARGLQTVLADRSTATQYAEAARQRLVCDFAPEPWVERYRAIYDACLAS